MSYSPQQSVLRELVDAEASLSAKVVLFVPGVILIVEIGVLNWSNGVSLC